MRVRKSADSVKLFLAVCSGLVASVSFAASTPQGFHGAITLVSINDAVESVTFMDKEQLLVGNVAVVAIPLFTEAGSQSVAVNYDNGSTEHIKFNILDKQYPEERIQVTNEQHVTPSQTNLERINKEAARMRAAYALFTPQPEDLLPLVQPVEGRTSGVFGSRRFFNDQPRNPHSGLDLAAPTGTPIKNPAPGTVAVVGDFFFNGKTVLIDHGGGFISMMCHMSETLVEEGDYVPRGEVIGKIGSTGRSTGPHLHWTVSLNGVRTDPALFIAMLNALYVPNE